eukprot:CAMPEP_0175072354 /NCGR_PEP_ID=MMETSP0052_2-20121109/19855_1 /TAXON_ID=51329 ORGANISM="Polytomella parva, Strain SAG 63-3" /NCGR_SAMPLE_ID=MMETSP0052_2 /ASSEMBLY_ACC=CAM_ASM_000194 /LENGTH=701 /DNA_ID=CAMNT_0016339833 /DNA_START=323 /DNA_END=2424 /DNA_ORIENTATION=+
MELYPSYCTIEYSVNRSVTSLPSVYFFVVDVSVSEDELSACKSAILQSIQNLPDGSRVGLITFGTHVQVYELRFTECSKSYVLKGNKEYTSHQIISQLGLTQTPMAGRPGGAAGSSRIDPAAGGRFIMPLNECEFIFQTLLEDLTRDTYPVVSSQRPARCTGTALQVAAALMGAALPSGSCSAHALLFVGGPCTEGQGKVVSRDLMEEIRSHKDLAKDGAVHFRKAKKFYDTLAVEFINHGHALDVLACSLDQVGFAEMKEMVQGTGGLAVQTDTFHNKVFRESLQRIFTPPPAPPRTPSSAAATADDGVHAGDDGTSNNSNNSSNNSNNGFLGLASNATLEVIPSKDIKVAGLLGCAAKLEKKSGAAVADTEVGLGGTTHWKLCSLDFDSTVAVLFEIASNVKDAQESALHAQANPQLFLQFITRYMKWNGEQRCRVTTLSRRWIDVSNCNELVSGFDQEAAAVLVARLASHKMETEEDFDATRWLDRSLIRLAQRFGDYRRDDPTSFNLRPELSFFPQFMFNLRRSQFVQVFGNSPDETAYFRMLLMKVPTSDAMVMIQPQLTAFQYNASPEPVLLDVSSIHSERILLLDAFFYLVIFHGSTVAQWRNAGYHQQPEHAALAALLEAPQTEAKAILNQRFPVPKLVDCDQNKSQARFLLARLNPSSTYSSAAPLSAEVINTDDVSLDTFTEHLKRYVTHA